MHKRLLRRRVLAAVAAVLALPVVLTGCIGQATPPKPQAVPTDGRPNIVFVLTDDLAMNLLPYMPHIQALARAGTSFENYYVVDSLCCPSRAAIFTGLYPHDDGVYTNRGEDGGYQAYNSNNDPSRSFAVGLHDAGYYTGFMGKYLNRYEPFYKSAKGWDVWDAAGDAYGEYNYDLNENNTLHHYGHAPSDYLTTVLTSRAVGFIQHAQYTGKPFALEVASFAPHRPSVPAPADVGSFPTLTAPRSPAYGVRPLNAPRWLAHLRPLSASDNQLIDDRFRLRVEAVQSVDRMVGRIERTLAATGQLDNTYIVFSSDNGFHMGEHNMLPGKQTAFDTDIRVPLVVYGPGVPADHTVDAMTSSIDLAPTFLAIGAAQPTAEQDGVSLLDLWHGQPPPPDWQRAVLVEHHGPVEYMSDPDFQGYRSGDPPSYEAMRTKDFLYVEYQTGEREYYDLVHDPYENDNIFGSLSPRRQDELHLMLSRLEICHGSAECQRAAQLSPPKANS